MRALDKPCKRERRRFELGRRKTGEGRRYDGRSSGSTATVAAFIIRRIGLGAELCSDAIRRCGQDEGRNARPAYRHPVVRTVYQVYAAMVASVMAAYSQLNLYVYAIPCQLVRFERELADASECHIREIVQAPWERLGTI